MALEKTSKLEYRKELEDRDTGKTQLKDEIVSLKLPSEYLTNRTNKFKLTDDVAAKLEYAFKKGHTIKSACNFADVKYETYIKWTMKYPMFKAHMEMAQEYLKDKALKTVAYYLDNKDPDVAKWYLERKYSKEYSKTPDMLQQINNYQVSFIEDEDEPK